MSKREGVVVHARGEYVPELIEAMKKAGYKLDIIDSVQNQIHLEFKPRKK